VVLIVPSGLSPPTTTTLPVLASALYAATTRFR
jgi:hypothetical protein